MDLQALQCRVVVLGKSVIDHHPGVKRGEERLHASGRRIPACPEVPAGGCFDLPERLVTVAKDRAHNSPNPRCLSGPTHNALPTPSSARITTNIRSDSGIQHGGRDGLAVVGSGLGIAIAGIPSDYPQHVGQ